MRHRIALFFIFLLTVTYASSSNAASSAPVVLDYSSASLSSTVDTVKGDSPFWILWTVKLEDEWHSYWKNPGDYGIAPTITWKELPDGFEAGPIHWQAPHKIPTADLMNYGYSDTAYYLVPVTPPADTVPGKEYTFTASANWLVCKEICVPQNGELTLTLVGATGEAVEAQEADNIMQQVESLPQPLPDAAHYNVQNNQFILQIGGSDYHLENAYFYSGQQETISTTAKQIWMPVDNGVQLMVEAGTVPVKTPLDGLVVFEAGGIQHAYTLEPTEDTSLTIAAPPKDALTNATIAPTTMPIIAPAADTASTSIIVMIAFAVLGGIILNAMPCVFPILSLKCLAVAKKASHAPAAIRLQGLAYTVGVLVSFAVVAGTLLILRNAGEAIGWGYQMQSPLFVAFLIYLLFLVGLNLSGMFTLPTLFANAGSKLTQGDSPIASFFTGVLATLVATPCTAPFMAPALGVALTQPPFMAMLIFLALGFGLALPYLLVSLVPSLLKWLPKPGAWMDTFKQFLAFPMYASCVWLLWVLAQQSGPMGLASAMTGMLLMVFLIWLWRVPSLQALWIKLVLFAAIVALLIATLLAQDSDMLGNEETIALFHESIEPYSPERLQEAQEQGRTVFVNATAAWCITCKVNERVALRTDAVLQAFADKDVLYLEADWTRQDERITDYLKRYGRSGVPLYVLYAPGKEPQILPQLLTPSMVIDALYETK